MNKSIKILIIGIIFLFIGFVNAQADDVYKKCTIGNDPDAVLNFSKEGKYISFEKHNYTFIQSVSEAVKATQYSEIAEDKCPTFYYCIETVYQVGGQPSTYYNIFADSLDAANNNFTCKGKFLSTASVHGEAETCPTFDNLILKLKDEYDLETKEGYKKTKERLSVLCKSVMSQNDYMDSCVQSCLDLNDTIALIEADKNNPNENKTCIFSERLAAWIMNILRWVKYIVPVLLIVLSMLDFIKAMAGEKDDELKKAQKHFTVRLIAAVLIFLIPFILEFIFDKMGFVYEGCGIFK